MDKLRPISLSLHEEISILCPGDHRPELDLKGQRAFQANPTKSVKVDVSRARVSDCLLLGGPPGLERVN